MKQKEFLSIGGGEIESQLSQATFDKEEEKKKAPINLIIEKEKEFESVGLKDYHHMAQFSCGWFSYIVFFVVCIVPPAIQLAISYWLAIWTEQKFEV